MAYDNRCIPTVRVYYSKYPAFPQRNPIENICTDPLRITLSRNSFLEGECLINFKNLRSGKFINILCYIPFDMEAGLGDSIKSLLNIYNVNVLRSEVNFGFCMREGNNLQYEKVAFKVNDLARALNKPSESIKKTARESKNSLALNYEILIWVREKLKRDSLLEFLDQGDPRAECAYAFMCFLGKGGRVNLAAAREYFEKAALQGCKDAQVEYAKMCYKGTAGERDLGAARHYFKKSADRGDCESQLKYAFMCQKSEGGQEDLVSARIYFKKAAGQGNQEAMFEYAMESYRSGDFNEARAYLKQSADLGCMKSQYNYAFMCYESEFYESALEYYKKAAEQGCVKSQNAYAFMCYKGKAGSIDFTEAREFFKRAGDQGDAQALYDYAQMCFKGKGGKIDVFEAKVYLKKAADLGHGLAKVNYLALSRKSQERERRILRFRF
jgi:TPR repeat protein